MTNLHCLTPLRVQNLKRFSDCIEITFDLNKNVFRKFKHFAGQYITLRVDIDGIEYARSYSITGFDHKSLLKICVKKVPGGIVSNYLYSKLKISDLLKIEYPNGDFTIRKKDLRPNQNYVFISGGSGITPMLPMIQEVLEYGKQGGIYLIYGNRKVDSIIYREELEKISDKINTVHLIESIDDQLISPSYRQGILSEESILTMLKEFNIDLAKSSFFLSGPPVVIQNAENTLSNLEIPERAISKEQFFIDVQKYADGKDHRIRVRTNKKFNSQIVPKNMSLLDSCILSGENIEYSCRVGECKKCSCTLLKGSVNHRGEIKDKKAKILACQSFPLTDEVIVDFKKNIFAQAAIHRTYSLLTFFLIALLVVIGTRKSYGDEFIAAGPLNTGHEEISCVECHKDEEGTIREQLQGQIDSYLHAGSESPFFVKRPLQSGDCISCHDKGADRHPIHRFNEPKFSQAKQSIHPEKCTSCHLEHNGKRITIDNRAFCIHCHDNLKLKKDPIKPSHSLLIENSNWESCLQCHDYHGNHIRETPTNYKDTISQEDIKIYFEGGKDPYSKEKYFKTAKN